jgi:hypothetical protein
MLKKATLICPKCKLAAEMTVKEGEPFPSKCDKCGSERVMITHLLTNIKEPDEIDESKKTRAKVERASKAAAEAFAKASA